MLTRRAAHSGARLATALLLVLVGLMGAAGSARADVTPCANSSVCVGAGSPGSPGSGGGTQGGGSGGGSGGGGSCYYNNQPEPCYVAGIGTFDPDDGCYYTTMQPQPPAGDPLWQGHQPGDGAVYVRTCALNGGGGTVSLWLAAAPPAAAPVTPAQLAQQALKKIKIINAQPETAPGGGKPGLVNTPVMLWLQPFDGNPADGYPYAPPSAPAQATASVPGLSVTAKVWSTKVTWNMGDGTSVVCPDAGTPYAGTLVNGCTHTYSTANNAYAVNAAVSWTVTWSGGGQTGAFNLDDMPSKGITLTVDEIQVLN
ncbi:hypothetical protein [Streptacidiphilus fuscans]|uniref:ATP/GTP-binding protein n=1 Tax=Streptacidiphilus fuscans TaxID=2789292 RepID=A0A931F9G4_9ACTN|nr:hypothetical protein [Streptacidiphilus fuscans]MBF9066587.1 hypothetical protein [Streptacidiphilus fuscans]